MKKIIVAITGASGTPLAINLLKKLHKMKNIQTHLVLSNGAKQTIKYESKINVKNFCDIYHKNTKLGASIASGTFKNDGMIIIPCSMNTVASLANGIADNLLLRSADVCIKQKRKLLLVPRETPLSAVHLENLTKLSKLQNLMILPPVLSYYTKPKSIKDVEDLLIGKILDFFDIELRGFKRWK